MNLTRLRYFVAVAEELHFGRAAAQLHMAQPPLSQQIRLLESELGCDLFQRTTRRVELTPAGRLLYPEALRLIRDADGIDQLMRDYHQGDSGFIRLGFVDSSSYAVMPQFVRAYRERWPRVQFELHTMSSDAQQKALLDRSLDLGIARHIPNDKAIAATSILEERLYLAVNTRHRLASQQSTSLRQLTSEALIGFSKADSPSLTVELTAMLASVGVDYSPVIQAEEYTTIVGLVAAGEGVAVVPDAVRLFRPAEVAYIPLRDSAATTRLVILTRQGDELQVLRQARELAASLFGDAASGY